MINPTFHCDFRKSLKPLRAPASFAWHERASLPTAPPDSRRGLKFPLADGAVGCECRDVFSDASGTIQIDFELDRVPAGDALLHAGGQYEPWIKLDADHLMLKIYQHSVRMMVRWQTGVVYTLTLSWDHTAGITLELKPARGQAQRLVRSWQWQAFKQKYVILAIGGVLAGRPVFSQWSGSFSGYVRAVKTWRDPVNVPGPSLTVTDRKAPLRSHADIKILELHDPPIIDSPWRNNFIPDRMASLRKNRQAWKLDALLAKCRTELETFAVLIHHVGSQWPHYHYWPWPKREQRHIFWKEGHEMRQPITDGEFGGMCGGYAHVMEELFWSLGHDARRTQVCGHSSFEAWSNQFNKWIICDASHNRDCHYLIDGAGVPMGCRDFILRYRQLETNPDAMRDVRAAICREDGSIELRDNPAFFIQCYFYAGFGWDDPLKNQGTRDHIWYFLPQDRAYFDAAKMGCGPKSTLVDNIDDLFWSCNRAVVDTKWSDTGKTLTVTAKAHQVTFSDGFEKRVDSGEWTKCRESFQWKLHAGVNQLEVRTRNKLGAKGHPWRMKLWRKP